MQPKSDLAAVAFRPAAFLFGLAEDACSKCELVGGHF